jgi:uracil-DNA glycosylase
MDDPKIVNFNAVPNHGHLIRWVQQGVLLLNAVMTVRANEANSHQNKGWEHVTDEIIRIVMKSQCLPTSDATTNNDSATSKSPRGCVFLLWGKPATSKAMNVIESVLNTATKNASSRPKTKHVHTVICTSHPSPLGARKTSAPFLGSRCFSRCNEALIEMGHEPINWNV